MTLEMEPPDPGVVRAGSAAAARRRELAISQRRLAADGIINAGALIAFEKGRSWPRTRTRAKLEEVLHWPSGTIARIRRGQAPPGEAPAPPPPSDGAAADGSVSLIAQAVVAAVDGCSLAAAALPPADDPTFSRRAAPILADLRRLETIAVRAARITRMTPELINALSTVRRQFDELMTRGADAPNALLAQRLYTTRRRAKLSALETAHAAGVPEDTIARAEAQEPLPAEATEAIETLLRQLG